MIKNNLISLLDTAFPDANRLFASPTRADGSEKWVDFVAAFPHCECVCGLSEKAFAAKYQKWCKKHGYNFSQDKALEWDLLSYLETYEPHELKRCGPHEYCTRIHDSLKISNGKWCWNRRGIGGRTALDYLIKVRGMDFVGAVEALCGYRAPKPQEQPAPKPRKPFQFPEASRFPSMMLAYLQGRGIHPELLQACIQASTLYESRRYQNCVFVGKDMEGRARFACLRGTRDNFRMVMPSVR